MTVENIIVHRQTRSASSADEETKTAVEAIAVNQQLTYEQLRAFWDEHQAQRRDTGTALGAQHERQE
ncbi:hypothetical protein Ae201684P_009039 [Aphanomyces euteiches]|uniref:Uncharacterized protein n=1 Tax=Aphanomyces euteiches TaxID=100861 RepID=A0A6G0WEG4_9STRA|nr:hypothetical protein Ae201684_015888 [Aphanomyces euteiches]KAH9080093.1 hypothetical protein Ae201684P_009039 [Aphanomyces euteiches]